MVNFSNSMTIQFRGAFVEIIYSRTAGDCEWWFADDSLNDVALTGRERQEIRATVLGDIKR